MSERKVSVKKKKKWGRVYEYVPTVRDSVLTEDKMKEIEGELKKAGTHTPQSLAIKHGIKVSLAKQILKKLETDNTMTAVFENSKHKIFKK